MLNHSYARRIIAAFLALFCVTQVASAQMLSSGTQYDQVYLFLDTSQSDDDGTANTITISASAQAGDIAVIGNFAINTDGSAAPTQVVPEGWLDASTYTGTYAIGTLGIRGQMLLKVLEEEDIGSVVTLMNDNSEYYQALYFAGNGIDQINLNPGGIVGAVSNGDADGECDGADITAQTFNSASDVRPLLGVAFSFAGGSTANVTSDIGFTGEVTGSASDVQVGYVTWDQDDADATHTMDATSGSSTVPACLMSQLIFQANKVKTPNRIATMSGTVATGATESENYPTGTVADDLVVMLSASDTEAVAVNDAGWTEVRRDGANEPATTIHWKIVESETSVSLTGDGSGPTGVQMITYRGANMVTPIETSAAVGDGASGDPDPPDLNPTDEWFVDTIFLVVGFVDDDNATTIDCPTGLGRGTISAGGGSAGATASVVSCERRRSTGTSLNAGIIVNDGDDEWVSETIAIRGR